MLVWRIARAAYQALDGEGARLNGGRWNSEGVAVVYTSSTLALAALEYLVHVDTEDVPDDLVALRIEVPDSVSQESVELSGLPADWNEVLDHPACVACGDAWARSGLTVVLRVPSSIIPEEASLLLNPRHREAAQIGVQHVRPFRFEPRLV